MPRPGVTGAGYPILKQAEHARVFHATRETGGYNHHPQIGRHGGRFHAIWSNHPHGEDGPGQRILYSNSPDGNAWSPWQELIPPPAPVAPSEEMGLSCSAFRFIALEGVFFAVVGLHRKVGFTDFDRRLPPVPMRDELHPSHAREGYASLALSISPDGSLGPIFATGAKMPEDLAFELADDPTDERLQRALRHPAHWPAWDFEGVLPLPCAAEDGHRLCEPTVYQDDRGQWTMLLRDTRFSHRMYVSRLDQAAALWLPAEPTDIPDSPSLSCNVQLKDGTVLLVGNQMAPAFDNWDECKHYSRDPLTVSVSRDGRFFTRCYALRCGVQQFRIPQAEVIGRGGGGQYPSALAHDGRLYVLYSMGKEDVWVSSFALRDIGIDTDESGQQSAERDAANREP